MKIQAKEHLRGQKRILPELGEVDIPKDGIIDVDNIELAQALIQHKNWDAAETLEEVPKKASNKKAAKKVVEDEEEDDEDLEDDIEDEEDISASLDAMTLSEMVEVAKSSAIKGWEKFQKNEKALRSFLKNKL